MNDIIIRNATCQLPPLIEAVACSSDETMRGANDSVKNLPSFRLRKGG